MQISCFHKAELLIDLWVMVSPRYQLADKTISDQSAVLTPPHTLIETDRRAVRLSLPEETREGSQAAVTQPGIGSAKLCLFS